MEAIQSSPTPSSDGVNLLCLTPTKNEAWILRHHLAAAAVWATKAIVADQLSTDGSRDIVRSSPGAELVCNDSPVYDENARQKMLLGAARKVPGRRILFGLDADEMLSSNLLSSPEWEKILNAAPGTVLRFRWVNILPDFKTAWIPPNLIGLGFVDDGSEHQGVRIHSSRVPHPPNAPTLDCKDIVVLHFQYVVWERMVSKQRWYQAWEHHKHGVKRPLDIFRQYNHMHGSWNKEELFPVDPAWLAGYEARGINYRELKGEPMTWWDREILDYLREAGADRFRRIAIWDQDWAKQAAAAGIQGNFADPRNLGERFAHRALKMSQGHRGNLLTRGLEYVLRRRGW